MKDASFEITNQDDAYRTLYIEPLSLKFGIEAGDSYTLVITGEPFQMYLGDSDDGIYIEIEGDVELKVMYQNEEVKTGHNIQF